MLEPQSIPRDAGGEFLAAVTAPLLAHAPSPAEPSPSTGASPEITDDEIDAATAACCRICLDSESEPGEHLYESTGSFLAFFVGMVCAQRDRRLVGLPCDWVMCAAVGFDVWDCLVWC